MTLLSVQYLRAVAAMMVVVFHLVPQLRRMGYDGYWPDWLAGGVDIFFIISGFIMWVTTVDRPMTPWTFFQRRLVRIAPLYWLLTTVVVIVMLVAPKLLQTTSFGLTHVLASYAFLPAISPATGWVNPVVNPGWTLNYEMFFYLVFGLGLLLQPSARFITVSLVLGGLVSLQLLPLPEHFVVDFYTSGLLLEFIFGMALARLYLAGRLLPTRSAAWISMGVGAIAFGTMLAVVPEWPRVIIFGMPALAIVTGALSLELHGGVRHHAFTHLLGDASYSIYLTHFMTLSAFGQAWRRLGLGEMTGGFWLFCIVATVVSTVIGLLAYRWVEQPLVRYFNRRRKPAAPVSVPSTAR
ncbi:acyltransferase [Pigmentiphaga aceris]|uniref:Acyltransferase n=1 Tax=Pigmentiphaga aceris TaxID=1940612 RepID=A0A5C0AZN1_9BURK|nr:acyltransferase [Pigmentiphaga aceris]QEI07922.1 acyltransferase [Pigmentiphaga aceris]